MIGCGSIVSQPRLPAFGVAIGVFFITGTSVLPTTSTILTADATTNISVGTVATDGSIIINYVAKRGSLYQIGEIIVLNKVSTTDVLHVWDGDDVGLTVTSDISSGSLRINMIVDDTSVENITFNYIKETVTL